MSNLAEVVKTLSNERDRVETELNRLNMALTALNGAGHTTHKKRKRFMSEDARERIAAAQRQRWAKVRAGKETGKTVTTGAKTVATGAKGYWDKMTPSERRKEMQRRRMVR